MPVEHGAGRLARDAPRRPQEQRARRRAARRSPRRRRSRASFAGDAPTERRRGEMLTSGIPSTSRQPGVRARSSRTCRGTTSTRTFSPASGRSRASVFWSSCLENATITRSTPNVRTIEARSSTSPRIGTLGGVRPPLLGSACRRIRRARCRTPGGAAAFSRRAARPSPAPTMTAFCAPVPASCERPDVARPAVRNASRRDREDRQLSASRIVDPSRQRGHPETPRSTSAPDARGSPIRAPAATRGWSSVDPCTGRTDVLRRPRARQHAPNDRVDAACPRRSTRHRWRGPPADASVSLMTSGTGAPRQPRGLPVRHRNGCSALQVAAPDGGGRLVMHRQPAGGDRRFAIPAVIGAVPARRDEARASTPGRPPARGASPASVARRTWFTPATRITASVCVAIVIASPTASRAECRSGARRSARTMSERVGDELRRQELAGIGGRWADRQDLQPAWRPRWDSSGRTSTTLSASSSAISPSATLASPGRSAQCEEASMPGWRRSRSTRITWRQDRASVTARFAAVVDLPSPSLVLVIMIEFTCF